MKTRRLPSLNALRALEAVRETGSISAAAERLSVSHSAVSQHIKYLQEWTNRPLIVRKGRSVVLTSAGESLAGVVNESFDSIRHELDLLPIRFERSVNIAIVPIIAKEIILPALPAFVSQFPNISLHISLGHSDRPKNPFPDIEIAFQKRDRISPGDKFFLPGTALPVASPILLDSYGGDKERAMNEAPLISDEDSRMWEHWFDANNTEDQRQATRPRLFFEGSLLMQQAAIDRLGIAFGRTCTIKKHVSEGTLVPLSDRMIDQNWAYVLRTYPQDANEPEVLQTISWLMSLSLGQ